LNPLSALPAKVFHQGDRGRIIGPVRRSIEKRQRGVRMGFACCCREIDEILDPAVLFLATQDDLQRPIW
jgi:hypothetical protein